jgi:hypothetical protein
MAVEDTSRLDAIRQSISRLGKSASECAALVEAVAEEPETQQAIRDLKGALRAAGVACELDTLERVLLSHAIEQSLGKIDLLPVPPSVRDLFRKQYQVFGQPPGSPGPSLAVDAEENDVFIAACKICTLRRFPAGPLDWVVSGMPRKWFLKMPLLDIPPAVRFIFGEFGGLKPAFYVHIAHPPRNRALIIAKEVRKAYYRMAQALMLQPEVKGIMCATWLHDPAAIDMYPYIAALNEPYLKLGGKLVTNLGDAPESSGFLKYNSARRELHARGQLKLKSVLAMWPRKAAIEWASNSDVPQL